MIKFIWSFLIAFLLCSALGNALETDATVSINGEIIHVRIASTPEDRETGLMQITELKENEGMLFVFEDERRLNFWMKNTLIALDIAFLNQEGEIIDIQTMDPKSEEIYSSRLPAMYALEVNAGWFESHRIAVGDKVEW